MNVFPSKTGIWDSISPVEIVEENPKIDLSRPKIAVSSYALVYTQISNDTKPRAVSGMTLRASNSTSETYFMSLYSDKWIHGYKWDELSIENYVVERVALLAEDENSLKCTMVCLVLNGHQVNIDDDPEEINQEILQIVNDDEVGK